jgi:kynureninase
MAKQVFSRADAEALDHSDPLAPCRAKFQLPEGSTYLVGHSLGPATRSALQRVQDTATDAWATGLVGSWNAAGWFHLAEHVGGRIGRLIGARSGEVMVCDSVSVNLFKLAAAALPLAGKARIMVEASEFPTDQYIAEALSGLAGVEFVRLAEGDGLEALRGGGVLLKSAVNFRTSGRVDMAEHELAADAGGGIVIWDLSHATGVLALDMHACGAKLAVGCTYKYLNGGPGAPAFVFAHRDIVNGLDSPLPGWMGHAEPFAFHADYAPKPDAVRFASGTPAILSLAALDGALDVFDGVHLEDVEHKAGQLGDMCVAVARAAGIKVSSPLNAPERGGHVSLRLDAGYPIVQALAAQGVMADFRTPDTIRFGCSPMFLSYIQMWDAMQSLTELLQSGDWDQPQFHKRALVT